MMKLVYLALLVCSTSAWMQPLAKRPPTCLPSMGPMFSYVEEAEFEDQREEIEAMGGDPSFLEDEPQEMDAWEEDETAYFD